MSRVLARWIWNRLGMEYTRVPVGTGTGVIRSIWVSFDCLCISRFIHIGICFSCCH